MEFFTSKSHFKEENLLLLSAVDLLIAVVHGSRDEFENIQKTPSSFLGGGFDWLRDHKPIAPMPRYVMDQHTSNPNPSVSFAMESSQVVGGDKNWTPQPWLLVYTAARIHREVAPHNQILTNMLISTEGVNDSGLKNNDDNNIFETRKKRELFSPPPFFSRNTSQKKKEEILRP